MIRGKTSAGFGIVSLLGAGYLAAQMSGAAVPQDDLVVDTHTLLNRINQAQQEALLKARAAVAPSIKDNIIVVTQEDTAPVVNSAALITAALGKVEQPYIELGPETSVPLGHSYYCRSQPAECDGVTSNPVVNILTQESWQQLIDVNNDFNIRIRPMLDEDKYKAPEFWTKASLHGYEGDCEDYVLDKRAALIEKGWSPSALLIAVVTQKIDGAGHAVLIVRTDRGDMVLDNQSGLIKRWDEVDSYTFIKVSDPTNEAHWRLVEDMRPAHMAAVHQPDAPSPL